MRNKVKKFMWFADDEKRLKRNQYLPIFIRRILDMPGATIYYDEEDTKKMCLGKITPLYEHECDTKEDFADFAKKLHNDDYIESLLGGDFLLKDIKDVNVNVLKNIPQNEIVKLKNSLECLELLFSTTATMMVHIMSIEIMVGQLLEGSKALHRTTDAQHTYYVYNRKNFLNVFCSEFVENKYLCESEQYNVKTTMYDIEFMWKRLVVEFNRFCLYSRNNEYIRIINE